MKCAACGLLINSISVGPMLAELDAEGHHKYLCFPCAMRKKARTFNRVDEGARCDDCDMPVAERNLGAVWRVYRCVGCERCTGYRGNARAKADDRRITKADREWLKKMKCSW